jgi:Zn-dependent protease with chaperone function
MVNSLRMRGIVAFVTVMLLALVTRAAGAAPYRPPHDDALEKRIQAEIEAKDPEGAALFAQATAARERGDDQAIGDLLEKVHARDPWFTHATRRLCGAESGRGHHERAIALCREAYEKSHSPLDATGLATALLAAEGSGSSHLSEALDRAEEALHGAPDDYYAAITLAQVALRVKAMGSFARAVGALRRIAPHDAFALLFMSLEDGEAGRLDLARAELEEAHRGGLPDEQYDRLSEALDDARSPVERYGKPAFFAFVAWLAAFALLLGVGAVLSRATLRASGDVPTERTGHARGTAALLRRTYRLVLWVTCAYYYVSLPLLAVGVLAMGLGVVYACLAIGQIPIKLVLIVGVIVLSSLWAIAKSVLVRGKDEDPGEKLALGEHPRLRAVLDEVAARIGTRPVDSVYVTPGTEIAVLERGGLLRQLRGKSERCLVLGAAVLDGMRVRELKAILAHEYGHFHNEDTAGGGFAIAVRRSLMTMAVHLVRGRAASNLNPAWWFVKGFHSAFLRVSQGASRLQEVLADRWAAFAYGSEAFVSGLRHVIERSVRFDSHVDASLGEVVAAKQPLANLYAFVPQKAADPAAIDAAVEQALARPSSPFDSHPRPADRIAWVTRIAAPSPEETPIDAEDAWALLADRKVIEERMTSEVRARLARQGIRIQAA